jgi:hypothetical protein
MDRTVQAVDNPVVRLLGGILWAVLALCAITAAGNAVQWLGKEIGGLVALGGLVVGGVFALVALIKLLTKS